MKLFYKSKMKLGRGTQAPFIIVSLSKQEVQFVARGPMHVLQERSQSLQYGDPDGVW